MKMNFAELTKYEKCNEILCTRDEELPASTMFHVCTIERT